jgi:hypothetical protein
MRLMVNSGHRRYARRDRRPLSGRCTAFVLTLDGVTALRHKVDVVGICRPAT